MITGESPAVQMVILLQEPLVQHTPWYQSSSGIHHPQGSDSSDTYGDIYIYIIHIIYILYTYYIHVIYMLYTYYIHVIYILYTCCIHNREKNVQLAFCPCACNDTMSNKAGPLCGQWQVAYTSGGFLKKGFFKTMGFRWFQHWIGLMTCMIWCTPVLGNPHIHIDINKHTFVVYKYNPSKNHLPNSKPNSSGNTSQLWGVLLMRVPLKNELVRSCFPRRNDPINHAQTIFPHCLLCL